MSLLNTMSPERAISWLQTAADFTLALRELNANPDLEKLAKDAHALPAREMEKAQKARDDIKNWENKIADAEATMAQMDAYQEQINAQEEAVKKRAAELSDYEAKLDKRKRELEEKANYQSSIGEQIRLARISVDEKEEALRLKEQQVKDREKALDIREAEMKERAAKLQELTKGL